MVHLAVIIGSLRKDSFNKRLVLAMEKLSSDLMAFQYVAMQDIPLYNEDDEKQMPQAVIKAKELIKSADGVLIATPEYNRSFPGVLKNALDWFSRPYGQSALSGKPVGIVGISPGAVGTAPAQLQLRSLVAMLGMKLLCPPEVYMVGGDNKFTPEGELAAENDKKFLRLYLEQLAAWVEKQK